MDIQVLNEVLVGNLKAYDSAIAGIQQCLSAYESECADIIEVISRGETINDVEECFDTLYEIHGNLSKLLFLRNIEFGPRLSVLVKEFDRLHDPYIRNYWLERFKKGERWPAA